MTRRRLVIVGDVLFDRDILGTVERIAPDAPVPVVTEPDEHVRPGGAGLAAWFAAQQADVTLLTALGDGDADDGARAALRTRGVDVLEIERTPGIPQKIRVRADGHTLLRMERSTQLPTFADVPTARWRDAMRDADVILVSDYGAGITSLAPVRDLLSEATRTTPVVWDPHPRGGRPIQRCAAITPNLREARAFAGGVSAGDGAHAALEAACVIRDLFAPAAACVTIGADGAVLVAGDVHVATPPTPVVARDVCGAGDRFAVALALELALGRSIVEATERAVAAASAYVADPDRWLAATAEDDDPPDLGERRRSRAITVATSGCFDLLHAGHVRMLAAGRALGDRLVVLLNDDDSVRRRKGPGRPIVPAAERAELLQALNVVDEVRIFSEDTPERALGELRPDIYVKGGDYVGVELPEQPVVERAGGRVVILPYADGRSTGAMIERSRASLRSA
jgi:D-beta-D-heptose 7-phosphate kinase/D-beta-D-heptose 1-phosphate adenosyltransferase